MYEYFQWFDDPAGVPQLPPLKVTHEDIRDILHAVSVQKPAQGWEFKLPTDQEFGSKLVSPTTSFLVFL